MIDSTIFLKAIIIIYVELDTDEHCSRPLDYDKTTRPCWHYIVIVLTWNMDCLNNE